MRAVFRTFEELEKIIAKAAQAGVIPGDRPLLVTINPYKRPRTLEQNAKLHAMFSDLAEHTGYSPAEIKDYFKDQFGLGKTVKIGGKPRVVPKSTTEYSVDELAELIERVYQVGAEAGCTFEEASDE